MHNQNFFIRICVVFTLILAFLAFGYPIAFIAQHGWSSAAWPANLPLTPIVWLHELPTHYLNFVLIAVTYWQMLNSTSPSFAGGGFLEFAILGSGTFFISSLILLSGKMVPRRDSSNIYGSSKWAAQATIERMNKGLEIGVDPVSGRSVRVQVEGNLVTIAPPRTGKTGGFIIPNLVFSEPNAWAGPAVVIDPKGDVFKAVRRNRMAMGKTVRCIDPLDFAGGMDRWNPLTRIDPANILYLQSMALALLPQSAQDNDTSAYFRSRAVDIIVAAILATIRNGQADPVGAAVLIMDQPRFLKALENRTDQTSIAAREILQMEERARENITSTAAQATQWLRDERMQAVVQNHTFDLSDLSKGDVDLFIILPADDRKVILAPYVRWLLADLFESVRRNRPAERIITFIDETYVLGRFESILRGVGELPGYGVSLWTFWQSRHQMIETYGSAGADMLIGAAEVTNFFNLPASLPEELEHWSSAIGEYTGVKSTTGRDANGRVTESNSPERLRLVPATDLSVFLHQWQVVFLTGTSSTPDPIKLRRTSAYTDPRFAGLIDGIAAVGKTT